MSIPEKPTRAPEKTIFRWHALDRDSSEDREDSVRKDLTHRLKCVCEKLSSEEFEALILKMTREQLRGKGIPLRTIRPC
jgi:hypothetical protein